MLDTLKCKVMARHISGRLNVKADALSRTNQIIATEWSIKIELLWKIWEKWGIPEVDLFTASMNKNLSGYVSPRPGYISICFSPLGNDRRNTEELEMDQAEMILIAPKWDRKPWFLYY